jgi:hypothetical protein
MLNSELPNDDSKKLQPVASELNVVLEDTVIAALLTMLKASLDIVEKVQD